MKFYVQVFLISMIILKGVLISMYLFHSDPPALFTGAVAMALEQPGAVDIEDEPPSADDGGQTASANTTAVHVDALSSEGEKETAGKVTLIEEREKFLARREQQLLALQDEINKKIEDLTRLRDEIRGEMDIKKTAQENQVKHLIKIYSTMKPQKVAELIEKLDIDLITELFSRMKGDVVGQILSFVDTGTGAKITQGLFPADLDGKTGKVD